MRTLNKLDFSRELNNPKRMRSILAVAQKPNLAYKCAFTNIKKDRRCKAISDFDQYLERNKIHMKFRTEDIENDEVGFVIFSQKLSGDHKKIAYCLNNLPIIIKPTKDRYKTVKGLITALFSATFDGDVLGRSDDEVILLTDVKISVGDVVCYATLGSDE